MLKIKDNVDLSILEKYGFTYMFTNFEDDECWFSLNTEETLLDIGCNDREIIFYCNKEFDYRKPLDILFDMIQDGLVEKVKK